MIKLKKLLKENYWNERKFGEPLPTLRLEQDEPEHFGGGENIKILDYQTEHFDICRSAVILYQRLVKDVDNTDAQDLIVSSAKQLDHLCEMEKQVVRGEELDHDPIDQLRLLRIAEFICCSIFLIRPLVEYSLIVPIKNPL